MSMPEETPAAVTYLPSMTTRSPVGSAPNVAEVVQGEPVRGGPPPLEQPGRGEQQRAGAHRGGPGAGGVGGAQPVEHVSFSIWARLAGAARDDDDVRGRAPRRGSARRRGRGCPWSVRDRAGPLGDEDGLGVREPGEDLVGADGVEGGEAVVEDDGDLHGRFLFSVVAGLRGWGRKRRRYSAGAVPRVLTKARRMASGVP